MGELLEAINCGSQNGGFLSLKLFVNGNEPKTEVETKETPVQNNDNDSTDEEEEDYVAVPRRFQAPDENPTEAAPEDESKATDILEVMKNAGVTPLLKLTQL